MIDDKLRRRVDDYVDEQDRLAAARDAAERERREADERRREAKREEREQREREMRDIPRHRFWGTPFYCHVCHRMARSYVLQPGGANEDMGMGPKGYTDRHTPSDLSRCRRCHKWTCRECDYRGVCVDCARKLGDSLERS